MLRIATLLLFFVNILSSKDVYQSVRLYDLNDEKIKIIAGLGVPLDHISGKKDYYIDLVTNSKQLDEILLMNFKIEILIPNLTEHYQSHNTISEQTRDFPLGSMQGNYTWSELNNRFEELQLLYPNLISEKIILGQSTEQRDIWGFKVSDNPNLNESEPEVLYTGLTHAREPLGMMNLFYFVQQLVEQYEIDPELNYLINNRELWFIPVINPDGYVYNELIEPNGGGMHRKNRLTTGCGNGTSRGVDLNRNYGFGWGSDNIGSSSDECSDTYRGSASFSELETQLVRDFILEHDFKNILHYHSYSNVYIHAFGDGSLPDEPDIITLSEIGDEMASYNGYGVGTGNSLIGYTVNGDAVDWTYGNQNIISYTPEVGSPSQGFWPSENEIIELCEDQMYPNKIFAFIAGSDIVIKSYNLSEEFILPGQEIEIQLLIENRGLNNSEGDIEISFAPLNNWVSLLSESFTMSEIDARDSDDFSFLFSTDENTTQGALSGIIMTLSSEDSYSRIDTIRFIIGQPETIFFENFESDLEKWELDDNWGLTEETEFGEYALTDSPEGEYGENQVTVAELNINFDFTFLTSPVIKFKTKWDIESNYDFVRFQGYNSELGWISLEGQYTQNGAGNPAQPLAEPGFDGVQEYWIEETIYLDQLNEVEVDKFRFIQTSDSFLEGDGISIDDFSILGYPQGSLGDFNLDSNVDIYDILMLSDFLLFGSEPTNAQLFYCDLNRSGNLDIMDLILLTNKILNF